jgi:hypothetical protein
MTTANRLTIRSLLVTLSASMASPLAGLPAAPSVDLAVIVNSAVSVGQLSAAELESIFTTSRRNWPDGSSVSAFSYPPEDAVRRAFDRAVLRMSADEVARFWLDQRVRGGSRPPRQVPDAALAVRLVAKLPGSIAYVPENLVNTNVKVVARIKSGKVVGP